MQYHNVSHTLVYFYYTLVYFYYTLVYLNYFYYICNLKQYNMKFYLVFLVLLLTSCADSQTVNDCVTGHQYGFFAGLWHGFIIGFSMIGSLFDDSIAIYAVNNNGAFYNLGFYIGTGLNLRMLFPKKKSE